MDQIVQTPFLPPRLLAATPRYSLRVSTYRLDIVDKSLTFRALYRSSPGSQLPPGASPSRLVLTPHHHHQPHNHNPDRTTCARARGVTVPQSSSSGTSGARVQRRGCSGTWRGQNRGMMTSITARAAFSSPSYLQMEGLATSRTGLLAVSCSALGGNEWGGELRVFAQGFETVGAVNLDRGSACAAFIDRTELIACGQDSGDVGLYAVNPREGLSTTPMVKLQDHDDLISCLAVNQGDNLLASGSWDNTVKVWDLQSGGRLAKTIQIGDHVTGVQFLDENVVGASGKNGMVGVWDLRTDKGAVVQRACEISVCSMVANEGFLLLGCGDGSIIEWAPRENSTQVIRKHNAAVHALAICPDTKRLLSGSDDGHVYEIGKVHEDFVRGAAWWGGRPVTSSWDGTVRFVEAK